MPDPTIPNELISPISTLDEAKKYIEWLVRSDCVYHLEEDATDLIEDIFTGNGAMANLRANELYELNWQSIGFTCPIEYMMSLTKRWFENEYHCPQCKATWKLEARSFIAVDYCSRCEIVCEPQEWEEI